MCKCFRRFMSLFGSTNARREVAASPSTWTQGQLGDETGTGITENSSMSVTLATQAEADPDNGLIAYQAISSAQDIQLICQVPAMWTGTPENFTFFGLQIREALTGTPVFVQNTWPNVGQTRTKHRLTTDGTLVNNYATGSSGQTLPRYLAITYDDSASTIAYWESDDNIDWFQIGADVTLALRFPTVYACLYATSHDVFNEITATLTNCSVSSTITISEATPPNPEPRDILFNSTFPSGEFAAQGSVDSGFRIRTLPEPQIASEITVIADGGDSGSGSDTRVVSSITPPTNGNGAGTTITPEYETYGIWTQLDRNKDYTGLNGGSLDKPRSALIIGDDGDETELTWGERWRLGFVIHVPDNWEIDPNGRRTMFLQCQSQGASWTQFTLEHFPSGGIGGGDSDDWMFKYNVNDQSTRDNDPNNTQTDVQLLPVTVGEFTAFAFDFVFNPFSVETNPNTEGIQDGADETFPANGGRMEVWTKVGTAGSWTKQLSLVDQPFGTVPHATSDPNLSFRMYAPTLKTEQPAIVGPNGVLFEAFYFGRVGVDSTLMSDVTADRTNVS